MTSPVLVIGFGNPSRGDDAVGPLLLDYVLTQSLQYIELMTDFQLQIEHALDLQNRKLVLFIDAAVESPHDVALQRLKPCVDPTISTHALSPEALLDVYQRIMGVCPPDSFLLTLKAEQFELGAGLSVTMQQRLILAQKLLMQLLCKPELEYWTQLAVH